MKRKASADYGRDYGRILKKMKKLVITKPTIKIKGIRAKKRGGGVTRTANFQVSDRDIRLLGMKKIINSVY